MTLTVITILLLMLTGYAGYVSPMNHSSMWGVLPLAFPLMFWTGVVLFVFEVIWCRRAAVVTALGFLCCAGPALSYCPLHVVKPSAPEGAPEFTLMTYNVHNFVTMEPLPEGVPNPMMDFVLDQDLDIVCLQEAYMPVVNDNLHLTAEQLDRMHEQYPYCMNYFAGAASNQTMLSKYPIEVIHVDPSAFKDIVVTVYRVTLPCDRQVTILNVHLSSLHLSAMKMDATKLNRDDTSLILNHIRIAAVNRAEQVNKLMQVIRRYGGPETIVCGDFNDVSDCFAIRELAGAGFRDAYPQVGFGPMVTYNAEHLYFTIDHILYRGALKPLDVYKDKLRASDHYPVLSRFAVTDMTAN